ncbi:response regulator [Puia sp. P3]|uniref:response regulator n=1 Tax=Puia sp. P3 TaxID=3423952 RepID=UPI003D663C11
MVLGENSGEVSVSVEDSGCGIGPEDIEGVFGKFRGIAQKGFGIGLYLVKHFVESHRGRVYCQSELGKGTRFTIVLKKGVSHLPADAVPVRDGASPADHGLLGELVDGAEAGEKEEVAIVLTEDGKTADEVITGKKSLLLIDDEEEIGRYLDHLFRDRYLLYRASNGEDGWKLAQQVMPDLVISDVRMQGMDGVELCNKIKRSEALGHIPVILLTGETATEARLRGIEGGADDYITKPFDKDLLRAKVETVLRNRDQLRRFFFDSITLKETAIKVPAEYQEFLRRCIEVVEGNLDTEEFTTRKFAQAMGISRSGLYQKVKSISGQSLNAFIRSIRLRRAAVLMLKDNMNVNQAAFQVGIGDARYFREQFVKLFGMTPSEYIKKYRPAFNGELNIIKG